MAAGESPRDIADQVATIIENNYFDAGKAHAIAADLRTAAHTHRFDALTNPRDLAAILTDRLQSNDHHFLVTWSAPLTDAKAIGTARASGRGSPADGTAGLAPDARRSAYGFQRVEMLPGAIGYIDMSTFADLSFSNQNDPARAAADAAMALVSGADAVILDLRNNGGGSPNMAGYVISAFTPAGASIYNTFKGREAVASERPKAPYPNPRLDVPLYILISGRTASAAESTAYTLQAAKRAAVVGESSAGASNPGGDFPVGDGFFVFVSTSTAINPITGTNWEGAGVKPDVEVAAQDALPTAELLALERVLTRKTLVQGAPDNPNLLEASWTLEALRAASTRSRIAPPLADYLGTYTGATISIAGGLLSLHRGRRPPWPLLRLHDDMFFVKDEPFRRVLFERDTANRISRFQLVRAGGPSSWFSKVRDRGRP